MHAPAVPVEEGGAITNLSTTRLVTWAGTTTVQRSQATAPPELWFPEAVPALRRADTGAEAQGV